MAKITLETSLTSDSLRTRLVVFKEHTLGFIMPGSTDLSILKGSLLKGSPYLGIRDPVPLAFLDDGDLRTANINDFAEFGVDDYYFNFPDLYEFEGSI